MNKIPAKRVTIPVAVLLVLLGIAFWLISVNRMNNKVPSRGVFVYSKEFKTV